LAGAALSVVVITTSEKRMSTHSRSMATKLCSPLRSCWNARMPRPSRIVATSLPLPSTPTKTAGWIERDFHRLLKWRALSATRWDFATGPPRISGVAPFITSLIQASIFAAGSGNEIGDRKIDLEVFKPGLP
jgi:hypothetical protein